QLELPFSLANPRLWSPENPALYRYTLTLESTNADTGGSLTATGRFGFRTISADGPRLLLNGRPLYLRGVLHWGCYEDTITPNPDEATIRDEIARCKAHGFNLTKHCLYIPRRRTFELADELGMLLWVELPLWLPEDTGQLAARIRREYPRILRQMAGHPALVLTSLGCELNDAVGADILEEMYHLTKAESQTLVRDNSGSGECYGGHRVDYADFFDYHFYGELHRMENLMEVFTPGWRSTRPWLYGEFCDSDTLRDLAPLRAARGTAHFWWEADDPSSNPVSLLKPDFHLGSHDARIEAAGIRADYDALRRLSLAHSMTHRKTTLEQTRSFPEIGGYVITSIRDVPIATSGIFDDEMREKFDPAAFAAVNGDLVLLPAWDLDRRWAGADVVAGRERYNFWSGGAYTLHILASNYSGEALERPVLAWRLRGADGHTLLSGEVSAPALENGRVAEMGYLSFTLLEVTQPAVFTLEAELRSGDQSYKNSWPVFVYPHPAAPGLPVHLFDPAHLLDGLDGTQPGLLPVDEAGLSGLGADALLVASYWSPGVEAFLRKGGKAVLMQCGAGPLPTAAVPFWREGMAQGLDHPVLAGCLPRTPQDDLRWFSLAPDTALLPEGMAEAGFEPASPILNRYDCRTWTRTEYLAEYRLGNGRMLATTLRLAGGAGKQPAGIANSPFAAFLLGRMLNHLAHQ
ncbi:hypothetical protein LJC60_08995, partial [Ruminococcaceae bacterium OttesenSCG-928-D13]|nr:hypothetical protein [Ruminococcaceae bacterium OttesenSCG-928-D13]